MSFVDTDIQSLGQSPIVQGLLWFVIIFVCGYLFTDRSLLSALSLAGVNAVSVDHIGTSPASREELASALSMRA